MLDKFFIEDYIKRNNIPNNPRRVLTEYLQSEILAIAYSSKFGSHISFLGGTCLRFVYKIDRFSEDLDFDLIKKDLNFEELTKHIEKKLKELGFAAEARAKETENIIIISVKFSEVLKEMNSGGQDNQKLKIKFEIDPNPQKNIKYESKQISVYGKNFNVISNSLETLFAQKIIALAFRPYQKGRDFYDIVWFLAQKNIEPNYAILEEKGLKIGNRKELVSELKKVATRLNLKQAAKDVERFLFYPEKAQWILNLNAYLDSFLEK